MGLGAGVSCPALDEVGAGVPRGVQLYIGAGGSGLLVIADGLGGQGDMEGDPCDSHAGTSAVVGAGEGRSFWAGAMPRRRSALVNTKIELSAMAPAPSMGERRRPKAG